MNYLPRTLSKILRRENSNERREANAGDLMEARPRVASGDCSQAYSCGIRLGRVVEQTGGGNARGIQEIRYAG